MVRKIKWALGAGLLALMLLVPVAAMADSPDDVATELICQCGCNMVLNQCNHAECSSRDGMMASIAKQLDAGRTKQQIVAGFVAQYGEKVLSAPTKEGFNLTAWVTPFVALLAGAVLVYFLVRAWVARGQVAQPVTVRPRAIPGSDEEYKRRLERELDDFARKGGY